MARLVLRLVTAVILAGLLLVPALATMGGSPAPCRRSRDDHVVPRDVRRRRGRHPARERDPSPPTSRGDATASSLLGPLGPGRPHRPVPPEGRAHPPRRRSPCPSAAPGSRAGASAWPRSATRTPTWRPAPNTYTIDYRIDGVLGPNPESLADSSASWTGGESDRAELVWQVVAAGWSMPISVADLRVSLPHPTDRLECSIGDGRPCPSRARAPASCASRPPTSRPTPPWWCAPRWTPPPPTARTSPGRSAGTGCWARRCPPLAVAVLISAVALLVGYLLERTTRERVPASPCCSNRPKDSVRCRRPTSPTSGCPPRPDRHAAAPGREQQHVELRQHGKDWTVTSHVDPATWDRLDRSPARSSPGSTCAAEGRTFTADGSIESGKRLSAVKTALPGVARAWGTTSRTVVPASHEWLWRALLVVAIGGVIGGTFVGVTGLYLMPFAAFAIGSVGVLMPGVGRRRTREAASCGRAPVASSASSAPTRRRTGSTSAAAWDLYTAFIPTRSPSASPTCGPASTRPHGPARTRPGLVWRHDGRRQRRRQRRGRLQQLRERALQLDRRLHRERLLLLERGRWGRRLQRWRRRGGGGGSW